MKPSCGLCRRKTRTPVEAVRNWTVGRTRSTGKWFAIGVTSRDETSYSLFSLTFLVFSLAILPRRFSCTQNVIGFCVRYHCSCHHRTQSQRRLYMPTATSLHSFLLSTLLSSRLQAAAIIGLNQWSWVPYTVCMKSAWLKSRDETYLYT